MKFERKKQTHVSIDEQLERQELPERERESQRTTANLAPFNLYKSLVHTHRVHNLRFVPFVNEIIIIITKSRRAAKTKENWQTAEVTANQTHMRMESSTTIKC